MQPLALCEIWARNSKPLPSYNIERVGPRLWVGGDKSATWQMYPCHVIDVTDLAVTCQDGGLGPSMYDRYCCWRCLEPFFSYIAYDMTLDVPIVRLDMVLHPSAPTAPYASTAVKTTWTTNTFDVVTRQRLRVTSPDFTQCQWLHGEGSPHAQPFSHSLARR